MQIYSGIEGIEIPKFDFKDVKGSNEREANYIQQIKNQVKAEHPNNENVGEEIRFAVADGYATYIVASIRPLELIHIGTGDAYHYPDVAKYKAKDIIAKIEQQKALNKLFSPKK